MVTERYGFEHRRVRRLSLPYAYGRPCYRCGRAMLEGQELDLDHADDGRSLYGGFSHAACNRRAGALKRNGKREARMLDPQIGIDVAHDRGRTAVVVAGWAQHPTGGKVIAARLHLFDGVMVADQIQALARQHGVTEVKLPGSGHCRAISGALTSVDVHEANAQDLADANGRLVDSLHRRLLRIPDPHPELTAAVQWAAVRPIGDGQVVDKRRSERDAAPLVALELAVWGLLTSAERGMPAIY